MKPKPHPLYEFMDDSAAVPTLHRANGPASSREAAEEVTRDGTRARHAAIVLAAVNVHPGLTAPELLEYVALNEYQVRRRLSDLFNEGKLRHGEQRRCRVKGRKMLTWYGAL
jgi:hypothetical protein